MTDKALRKALIQQAEEQSMRLPSNFAYTTLRRIEQEQKAQERRERIAAIFTIAASAILGIAVIFWFYGASLKSAIMVMLHHSEGISIVPAMTICALFLTLFNLYLQRKFSARIR